MGNLYCRHCNCPYHYYSNEQHARRPSCYMSHNNYHLFETKASNYIHKLKTCFENVTT